MALRVLDVLIGFKTDPKALQKVDREIARLKGRFLKLGAVTGAALGAVIAPAAQLERTLKDAVAASGKTGSEFGKLEEKLRKDALRMSDELGISANEIAKGFFNVISTGTDTASKGFEALSVTAFKFSKAAGIESGQAVEGLATFSKLFFDNMENAGQVADVFFKANTLAQTSVAQLADAMREAAPAGKGVGLSLEQTVAVLSAFAQAGFRGRLAGTAFRQVLTKLTAATPEGTKAIKKLGVEVFEAGTNKMRPIQDVLSELITAFQGLSDAQKAATANTIFGQEASSRFLGLVSQGPDLIREFNDALKDSGGAMDAAFIQIMDSAVEQAKRFWVAIKNLAATIGAPLLKSFAKTAKQISNFINDIREATEKNRAFSGPLVKLGATLLVLATIFTGLHLAVMMAIKGFILLNVPLLAALALAAGLILIGNDIIAMFRGQRSEIEKVGQSVGNWVYELLNGQGAIADFLREVGKVFDWIGSMFDTMISRVSRFIEIFAALKRLDFGGAKKAFTAWIGTGGAQGAGGPLAAPGTPGAARPPAGSPALAGAGGPMVGQITVNEVPSQGLSPEQKQSALTDAVSQALGPVIRQSRLDAATAFPR